MITALLIAALAAQTVSGFVAHPHTTAGPHSETQLGASFDVLKKDFPADVDVVKAGGWNNLKKLSDDPKGELVRVIVEGLKAGKGKVETDLTVEKVEALVTLMRSMNRGFEADLVDGDWAIVFQRQGKKSPTFQKAVGKKEKAGNSLVGFDIKDMSFSADVKLLKKGVVRSKVKYDPSNEVYDVTSEGKIVLRRIKCDITEANFKFWKLPRVSLFFLKRKGGYLDFLYMDEDMRITKGSRGGFFVHFRPEFLEKQLNP